jgi:DNA adenine methylase
MATSNFPSQQSAKPFLRWAGSKRKQLSRLKSFWSIDYERYIEPFCGSSCLFFDIAPNAAILGDNNPDLIELYRVVRDEPERLYRRLCRIKRDVATYNRWRALDPKSLDKETRALRFLYLNRNCFNGIYRTNSSGKFNVPMGKMPGSYFSLDDLNKCSKLLKKTKLVAGDFIKTLENIRPGDFIYMDPPFAMATNKRRVFREYSQRSFNTIDIPRFSAALNEIDNIGADFLVSYADCSEARILANSWNSVRLPVRRNIAGFIGDRKNAYELLITNKQIPSSILKN